MTESTTHTAPDASIAEKQQRLEIIIDQLDDGTVSLERAKELHEEGTALIDELDDELALGDGEVIERP